jgi:SAM-dependent MidA family methyltransferase
MTWRQAMQAALYGPGGFYARGESPARHFRTSVHASPGYAAAVLELLREVDAGLGWPERIDLVDVGAGRGELLEQVLAAAAEPGLAGRELTAQEQPGRELPGEPASDLTGRDLAARGPADRDLAARAAADRDLAARGAAGRGRAGRGRPEGDLGGQRRTGRDLAGRIAACAVEIAPRPAGLDPRIRWERVLPATITGLVIASEWLDNVPLDVVELTAAGPAVVQVDPVTGAERPHRRPGPADLAWIHAWWPLRACGERAEVGRTRCTAWAGVIRRIDRGVAVAADYGHLKAARPGCGTLTGYLEGRAVPAIPDGSRDITAHVALDACAEAGKAAGAGDTVLTTQRAALRALGLDARRPPLGLAASDPEGYALALCRASQDAELMGTAGLGGFGWLAQAVGTHLPGSLAKLT